MLDLVVQPLPLMILRWIEASFLEKLKSGIKLKPGLIYSRSLYIFNVLNHINTDIIPKVSLLIRQILGGSEGDLIWIFLDTQVQQMTHESVSISLISGHICLLRDMFNVSSRPERWERFLILISLSYECMVFQNVWNENIGVHVALYQPSTSNMTWYSLG